MPKQKLQLLNWFLLTLLSILLCSFQTTFWFQVVGSVSAPQLWLLILLYVALHRKLLEAILLNYFLTLVISPFTSMGLGMLWTLSLLFTFGVGFAKQRVFWPGTRYFILASFLATLSFQIIFYFTSYLLESNRLEIHLWSRVLELFFTCLWAAPVYWLLSYVDQISERDPLPERGGNFG